MVEITIFARFNVRIKITTKTEPKKNAKMPMIDVSKHSEN